MPRKSDKVDKIEEVHRMLKWLVIENLINDKDVDAEVRAGVVLNQPDISDIIAGK